MCYEETKYFFYLNYLFRAVLLALGRGPLPPFESILAQKPS